MIAIGDAGGIHIDGDMPAHAALVIKNVGAQARMDGKHLIEHIAHGSPGRRLYRAGQMPLQIGGECNARHAAMLARVEFAAKYQYASADNHFE
jgi:hypothetical protein